MRKILLLLLLAGVLPAKGQKLYSTYRIFATPKDSTVAHAKLFTDREIQLKFRQKVLSSLSSQFQNPVLIVDSDHRVFDRVVYNDTTRYLRRLVTGYYNLYSGFQGKNQFFLITHGSDSTVLVREDRREGNQIRVDSRYRGVLLFLAKDYPEMKNGINKVDFKSESIQSVVYDLNSKKDNTTSVKYATNIHRDFFHIGVYGGSASGLSGYIVDVMFVRYLASVSRDLSIRIGLTGGFFDVRAVVGANVLGVPVYGTNKQTYFGIPLTINYEITNSVITPYVYIGIAPIVSYKETNDDKNLSSFQEVNKTQLLNMRAGGGLKIKPTKGLSLFSGVMYDNLNGVAIAYGLEYNIGGKSK